MCHNSETGKPNRARRPAPRLRSGPSPSSLSTCGWPTTAFITSIAPSSPSSTPPGTPSSSRPSQGSSASCAAPGRLDRIPGHAHARLRRLQPRSREPNGTQDAGVHSADSLARLGSFSLAIPSCRARQRDRGTGTLDRRRSRGRRRSPHSRSRSLTIRKSSGLAASASPIPARKVPATADTVYRVGSVSKLFTDLAVMQLVEQGNA